MKLRKSLQIALNIIIHSKLRSWLTIIGIVIGVSAVIAIMSIGAGLQQTINSQLSGLGGDIVTVTAGASRGGGFGGFGGPESRGGATATKEAVVLGIAEFVVVKTAEFNVVMEH